MTTTTTTAGTIEAVEWTALVALVLLFVWKGFVPAWATLNSDFPNYYLVGKLFKQGYPLERVYDWIWLARQKDHAGIDQPVVGFVPLTLFSALIIAPLTSLPPLEAKRVWLVANLFFLGAVGVLLRRLTSLAPRRIALIVFLAVVPLRTNFQFGQQHLLILLLITLAAWLYATDRPLSAGSTLAVAAALKLYPALFAVYFVRKRQWRAAGALVLTFAAIVVAGILIFGLEPLRVYAQEIVPRTLRGECNDPFTPVFNSPAALLRRLFVAEPELNPHPLLLAPMAFVVLQPLIQALIFVPPLWLMSSRRREWATEKLEWGVFVALLLVGSAGSATYHFCALIVAAALAVDFALARRSRRLAAALLVLYAGVCFPFYRFVPEAPTGWTTLLAFPRLYAVLALWLVLLWAFRQARAEEAPGRARWRWESPLFVLAFGVLVAGGVVSNVRHLATQQVQGWSRVVDPSGRRASLVNAAPALAGAEVFFTRMDRQGYVLDRAPRPMPAANVPAGTDLFFPVLPVSPVSPAGETGWLEVSSTTSRIVRFSRRASVLDLPALPVEVPDAEQPAISADGRWLGFLRVTRGRGDLYLLDRQSAAPDGAATGQPFKVPGAPPDVLEIAFAPDGRIVVAANRDHRPRLFAGDRGSTRFTEIAAAGYPARYPAVSPDGRWLAYSQEQSGGWQLRAMSLASGERRSLTDGDCNSISPTWAADGRSIVYASDCGRGIGHTALCRIQVAP